MWSAYPLPPLPSDVTRVAEVLDPVLVPLGFAPGQCGASADSAQVIFCRGDEGSTDGGCIDLVVDLSLDGTAMWRVSDVRYWGVAADRWHLDFPIDASLDAQLSHLTETVPALLR